MKVKPVTYTIPEQLDVILHAKVGRGQMSKYVTKALWAALKRDDETLLMQFLESDKDIGNIEVKQDFADIEGEDFFGANE